jgi:stearoyl-CoA desaturase (delta-9 desaturase)
MLYSMIEFLSTGLTAWTSIWTPVIVALVFTHITIAAVTIYLHRAMAHRALDLHPLVSHFFRGWLWLTTGMQTKDWVSIHRKHHAKCETEQDPHSPQTRGIKKVFFEGAELYRAEAKNQETLDKYSHGCPDDWVERNVYSRFTWQGAGLMLIANWLLFGLGAGTTIWAVQMIWIPVTAAGIINGIGHYWGYRNFDCEDASRNVLPWGILIGGEELHNNHHTFATSARLSNQWYEFDIGWLYIKLLSYVGLAQIRKVAPRVKLNATAKAQVDGETLAIVMAHRYDVMRSYARELKRTYKAERGQLMSQRGGKCPKVISAKRWLAVDGTKLPHDAKTSLADVLAGSEKLKKLYDMRTELMLMWTRSTLSRDQLLKQLQDWCAKAEASGVQALTDLSMRLRRYAAV